MKQVIIIFLTLFSLSIFYSQELVFAIGEWPPYTTESEKGLATEIVLAACNSVGIRCKIIHVPWLRAENYVEKGNAFATFPYAITKERQNKYLFSDPIFKSRNSIIYNNTNTKIDINNIRTIESFKNYKVGINTGSDALEIPLRNIGAEVETTEIIDLSMKKLQTGRIDFIIEDFYVITDLIKRYHDKRIVEFEKNVIKLDREYCVMVTKNNNHSLEYIKKINKGIKIIKSTGEYQSIVAKY